MGEEQLSQAWWDVERGGDRCTVEELLSCEEYTRTPHHITYFMYYRLHDSEKQRKDILSAVQRMTQLKYLRLWGIKLPAELISERLVLLSCLRGFLHRMSVHICI